MHNVLKRENDLSNLIYFLSFASYFSELATLWYEYET